MERSKTLTLMILVSAIFIAGTYDAIAQENKTPEGYELVDSLVYTYSEGVDSLLSGKDVFHIMPLKVNGGNADVEIYQSQEVASLLRKQVAANASRKIDGYRVRIFFDNKQTSRADSYAAVGRFKALCPHVKVYHTYTSPYFRVTVGDFRTKSEAMAVLAKIKASFPSAFIVREKIKYPPLNIENDCKIDTVKVLRQVR